jgi:hypothetical protein
MIFSITADMARQEREILIERIVSGLAEAKRKGKRLGRSPGVFYTDDELRKKYAKPLRDLQQGLSIRKVAKIYELSADTIQRIKKRLLPPVAPAPPAVAPRQTLDVSLWLRVENNNSFVRGKTKARESIELFVLSQYEMQKQTDKGWDYRLTLTYQDDQELEQLIDDILRQASSWADNRNCFIEWDLQALDGSERSW